MTDTKSTTLVYIGEALARYGFGNEHPFGPRRMAAFWDEAVRQGLDQRVTIALPCQAGEEAIGRFHTSPYIERVKRLSQSGEGFLDMGDTPAFKGMFEAAATVAGSVLDAADRLMHGEARHAFVPIAGLHHARRDAAAGFCVFNDCGILIEHLKQVHKLTRIAYVDIDAHHGDGVFYAFESDPDVTIADVHEDGRFLYPGTGFAEEAGKGEAMGTKLNLPLPPGATDADFMPAWEMAEAHICAFKPEFIILQCGADSIAGDPITHLRLSPAAHAHATASLCRLAGECCEGRLVGLGGGGYNLHNLAATWCAVLEEMLPED
ncbi:MAG: acetoin utilization protein AcuC [Zetaproteobacteria bacterium CG12_big_fil_rev_8_21_14_0_65_55_1124]|nr:MAG: acetoin utilization protein AcuC [Zetaproteobacteria bacterium CG1_02_55_237]PIS18580.1 MAG: acetoin utilization protein AcuC [Zetaproteobacteria bacterium CG08_land_8_20_14_0_20_55_17]PIW42056.1 MAG: acetoin utilization protein AcuC [Zetaproteobacteria bacterium CG12_big_fil_rev_8_21_14_0_65_55_1124]PIY53961.1 MAG: acetoin utilization protein AcuC [Zetaproteobacteria bacterium CG_4_10_14_0_8_um_filter_55_43]PIZ39407.1 MAG: acetoin utilization protein AcuC [Zetaproteobacteria bacterium 